MRPARRHPVPRAQTALSVALLAVLYLWVFPYHGIVNNPNENVRLFMTVALVDDGTLAINRVENTWGYTNDKGVRDTPLAEAISRRHVPDDVLRLAGVPEDVLIRFRLGRTTPADRALTAHLLYSAKAPGTSFVGVPAYWALTRLTGRNSRPPPLAPLPPPPPPAPEAAAEAVPPPPEAAPAAPPGPPRAPGVMPSLVAAPSLAPPPAAATPARPAGPATPPRQPIDRTLAVYVIRLFSTVLPALVFAWFWHRFLAARARSRTLREAAFFSTMAGSAIFAYSEAFTSHAHNAFCFASAIMAMCALRERDAADRVAGRAPALQLPLAFAAGLFGAGCTLFEYPAALASATVALWLLADAAERRRGLLAVSLGALAAGAVAFAKYHNAPAALGLATLAVVAWGATLTPRSVARLLAAGVGGAIPTGLLLFFHQRAFGDPFKTGYSFLENPTFRSEVSQGFFGATDFNWEAALRLWFDPSFGMVPNTFLLAAAALGVGALLSWRPSGAALPAASPVNARRVTVVRAAAGALLAASATKLALVVRAHADATLAVREVGVWLVATTLASVLYGSVSLPPPARRDRAAGVAVLACAFAMSGLIGMMNNWRGGWTVGPRYLTTLIPALAFAALAGLDAIHGSLARDRALQRVVTVFAAGATVAAFVTSGLVSATFPHVPEQFGSPFFEMAGPVLRDGFVPRNAGQLLGLSGLRSMAGFFVAAVAASALVLRGDERRPLAAVAHACGGLAVALALLVPSAGAARPDNLPSMRHVKTAYEPQPPPRPIPTPVAPPRETPAQAAARARRLAETGQGGAALDAWLVAIRAVR
ncbi:MAG: hypothetical protein U0324_06310 [Polyangiales bacterium]